MVLVFTTIFFIATLFAKSDFNNLYAHTFEEYKIILENASSLGVDKEQAIKGLREIAKKNPRDENIAEIEYIIAKNENNYTRKVDLLKELYKKRKKFYLHDEVGYNLASLYMLKNSLVNALNILKDITKKYPNSIYYLDSKLKIASIYLKINHCW